MVYTLGNVFHNLLDFYISNLPVSNDSFQFPILWNSCHLDQGTHIHFVPLFCCILQATTYFSAYSGNTIGLVGKKKTEAESQKLVLSP